MISSIGPFAANTYVPSFHAISEELGVSIVYVQQSLSVYLATFAVSALFVGALSDAIGRKKVVLGGTVLFIIASCGAMLSTSIHMLYFWRVLQGMAASVGPVTTQAIIRDRWQGQDAVKLIGLTAILFALSPAIAPMVGGYITMHFGWRAIFAFLMGLNATVFLAVLVGLKESHPVTKRQPFKPQVMLANYWRTLHNPAFVAGVIGQACCFLGGIIYSAGAADFVINIMHFGVADFGYLMVPLVICTMLGAWTGPRLMAKFGQWKVLVASAVIMGSAGVAGVIVEYPHALSYPYLIFGPMLYNFAMSMARPIMNVMNLDYYPKTRGTAASIQQFFQTSSFCLSSAVFVPLVLGHAWKYSLVMVGATTVLVICLGVIARYRVRYLGADHPNL